jgi:hypothetical protein
MTLLFGENEFVYRLQMLLKGDWRQQHAVRRSAKGALGWEAITAAVSEVWDGAWQQRKGDGASLGKVPQR